MSAAARSTVAEEQARFGPLACRSRIIRLTTRTTVNRFWQMYFGTGLVKTSEDFGVQGAKPSHPELLDWLANGIHRIRLGRESHPATDRHKCHLSAIVESDAGVIETRSRKPAACSRSASSVARRNDSRSSTVCERSVGAYHRRPICKTLSAGRGLWREVAFDFSGANLTAQIYQPDTGANLYRRSMYTFWKRTAPPPAMLLFDAPDRERCVVRRERTNTPLQALALMNDPTYVEAARRLAERIMLETDGSPEARVRKAFRLVTARYPSQKKLSALLALFERRRAGIRDERGAGRRTACRRGIRPSTRRSIELNWPRTQWSPTQS